MPSRKSWLFIHGVIPNVQVGQCRNTYTVVTRVQVEECKSREDDDEDEQREGSLARVP